MFGPVSGGHFNPVVSLVDAAFGGSLAHGQRLPAGPGGRVHGGAIVANLMFSRPAVSSATRQRASAAHFLSEVVATLGLILVIFALARSGRSSHSARPPSAPTSGPPTSSPARRASPIRPSPSDGCSPTASPVSPRRRSPASSAPSCWAGAGLPGADEAAYPGITPARPPTSSSRTACLGPHPRRTGRRSTGERRSRPSSSCAPTTPVAVWPPGSCSTTTPRAASMSARPGPIPATSSIRPWWPSCRTGSRPVTRIPQALTDETARTADVIVTMGCGDTCPVYPGQRYLDWDLDDPAGQPRTRSEPSSTRSIGGCGPCWTNLSRPTLPREGPPHPG